MSIDYYDEKSISQSQVRQFLKSPYDFWKNTPFNPDRPKFKGTSAISFGNLAHCLLLERDKFDKEFVLSTYDDFRTKEAREWKRKTGESGLIIVKDSEFKQAERMMKALSENDFAMSILSGGISEKPFNMVDKKTGLKLKGKVDSIKKLTSGEIVIIDYKTTFDIDSFLKFGHKNFNHIQPAMYEKLVKNEYNVDDIQFLYVIQSSVEGEEEKIAVAEYSIESLEYARDQLDNTLWRIKNCLDKHEKGDKTVWQAYPNEIIDMTLPDFLLNN